jgi:hypothetical protein
LKATVGWKSSDIEMVLGRAIKERKRWERLSSERRGRGSRGGLLYPPLRVWEWAQEEQLLVHCIPGCKSGELRARSTSSIPGFGIIC